MICLKLNNKKKKSNKLQNPSELLKYIKIKVQTSKQTSLKSNRTTRTESRPSSIYNNKSFDIVYVYIVFSFHCNFAIDSDMMRV